MQSILRNTNFWKQLMSMVLLSFLICGFVREDECVITWSAQRKLNWDDYKGKPKPRFAVASTVYSLGRNIYEEDHKVKARIEAFFYCNDSWKKKDWISDEVLAHEQKHFDIVELYARKLRKQASSLTYAGLKNAEERIDSLYKIISQEMDVFQDKYDEATEGSMNGDAQREWIKKIDNDLKQLDSFASSLVTLRIRSRE